MAIAQATQVAQGRSSGYLDAFRRAYLDTLVTMAAWRVAQDCQVQVAHWMTEGFASHTDLMEARDATKAAHKAYRSARTRYLHLSTVVSAKAGMRAGLNPAHTYAPARLGATNGGR